MLKLRVADSNKFIFIFPENCHLFLVLKHRLWGFAIVVVRIQILDPHQLTCGYGSRCGSVSQIRGVKIVYNMF